MALYGITFQDATPDSRLYWRPAVSGRVGARLEQYSASYFIHVVVSIADVLRGN